MSRATRELRALGLARLCAMERADLANEPIGQRAKEESEEEADGDEHLTPPRAREGDD
jgi:hypothetical protein